LAASAGAGKKVDDMVGGRVSNEEAAQPDDCTLQNANGNKLSLGETISSGPDSVADPEPGDLRTARAGEDGISSGPGSNEDIEGGLVDVSEQLMSTGIAASYGPLQQAPVVLHDAAAVPAGDDSDNMEKADLKLHKAAGDSDVTKSDDAMGQSHQREEDVREGVLVAALDVDSGMGGTVNNHNESTTNKVKESAAQQGDDSAAEGVGGVGGIIGAVAAAAETLKDVLIGPDVEVKLPGHHGDI
jgi:hypothetical protein